MKIICKSNDDLESVSDQLIAENVSEAMGRRIVKLLNKAEGSLDTPNYFAVVQDNYVLYKFEP